MPKKKKHGSSGSSFNHEDLGAEISFSTASSSSGSGSSKHRHKSDSVDLSKLSSTAQAKWKMKADDKLLMELVQGMGGIRNLLPIMMIMGKQGKCLLSKIVDLAQRWTEENPYAVRTFSFDAPYVNLDAKCRKLQGCESKDAIRDGDFDIDDGVAFAYKPLKTGRTEVEFTVEPKKAPWMSMMRYGFRPVLNCTMPPCYLAPNGYPGPMFQNASCRTPGHKLTPPDIDIEALKKFLWEECQIKDTLDLSMPWPPFAGSSTQARAKKSKTSSSSSSSKTSSESSTVSFSS